MTTPAADNNVIKFSEKWNEYVANFCSSPSKELKALRYGNLLNAENKNILEHLLMARATADLLCDLLGVAGQDKLNVVSAATIHDYDVLREKSYISIVAKNKNPTYFDLKKFKDKNKVNLRKVTGFSKKVIELMDENITHEDGGPKNLPAMIIFYTDAMLSGSEIVDIHKRFELTRMGWHSGKKIFDAKLKKRTAAYWNGFFRGAPGHGDRPHDVVQIESADRIGREFVRILKEKNKDTEKPEYEFIFGPEGDPNNLPHYLSDKLKERFVYS